MMKPETIAEILQKHLLWLRDDPAGSRAVLSGADLSGADLSGADLRYAVLSGAELRGADLRYAVLSGADLRGADLRYAVLSRADLSGADLRGADLRYAVLSGADLRGADLSGAVLSGAVLSGADLRGADLSGAVLSGADLSGAVLSGADLRGADIPVIPDLDRRILAAIEGGGKLEMSSWHTCQTTHCRAGWAVTVAGDPGLALERAVGTAAAAALMYAAIRPAERVPDFYASNEDALADIRRCALLCPEQ